MKNMYSVYIITNIINDMQYVGVTEQKPERRWYRHKYESKNKNCKSYSYPLQCAFREYGTESFKYELVTATEDYLFACRMEEMLIEKFNTLIPNGYNKIKGGYEKNKPVMCIETGEVFDSIANASEMCGINYSSLINCCGKNGKAKTAGSYHWKYVNDKINELKMEPNQQLRPVMCVETGEVFESTRLASITMNIECTSITSCCRGKYKTAGGYHWVYEGEEINPELLKPHKMYKKVRCIETGVVFNTMAEAAKWAGLKNHTSITNCCKGRQETSGGYHWEYYTEY